MCVADVLQVLQPLKQPLVVLLQSLETALQGLHVELMLLSGRSGRFLVRLQTELFLLVGVHVGALASSALPLLHGGLLRRKTGAASGQEGDRPHLWKKA